MSSSPFVDDDKQAESAPVRSLDNVLDAIGVSWFQIRLLCLCGLMFMTDAMEVTLLSFLSICAGVTFDLNDAQIASISSAVFAGQICGSLFWGPVADRYGRRIAFLLACALMTIGGVLSGLSPNFESLVIFRALVGAGVGGVTVPFDLLAEFLPPSERGSFLIFIEYFWTVGSIFVICMAWIVLRVDSWRILAYVTCIPVALGCFIAVWYLPESPRWLLMKGRGAEAKEVVLCAARVNGVELDDFTLQISEQEITEAEAEAHKPVWEVYMPLFDKSIRNNTLLIMSVWMTFAFLYYGIILYVTRLYSDNSSDGDTVCAFEYTPILENSTSEFLGVTLAILFINHGGRVKTQSLGYFIGGVAVFVMAFLHDSKNTVFWMALIARASAMGGSCATWVHTPELFPTNLRASGHSLCNVAARLAAFCSPYVVFSPLSHFTVAFILCLFNLAAALAASMLPETAGMSLEESVQASMVSASRSPLDVLAQNVARTLSGDADGSGHDHLLINPVSDGSPNSCGGGGKTESSSSIRNPSL